MLRINLLPPYVTQRRLTKRLVAGFSALFMILVGGLLAYNLLVQAPKANDLEKQATAAEARKAANDALEAQAQTTAASVAPIKAKLDFVQAVHTYNAQWAALYAKISQYLAAASPKILYSDATVSGVTMTLKAYTPSLSEAGRYYQAMLSEAAQPDSLFNQVALDQIPGYPDAYVDKYYLNGRLVGIGSSPAANGGSTGSSGNSGSNPNASGFSGSNGANGTGSGLSYGANRIPQTVAQKVTPLDAILVNLVNPLAPPEVQTAQREALKQRVVKKREQKGYELTVTLTLKQGLAPPAFPPTGGSSLGGSGSPMMPRGPGGPIMPGGSSGRPT